MMSKTAITQAGNNYFKREREREESRVVNAKQKREIKNICIKFL